MNGILWAALGTAIGLLAPLLFVLRQRGGAGRPDARPGPATPRSPGKATTSRANAPARQLSPKPPAGLNRKQTRKFHGISVKPGLHACKAAQQLAGQRFLPDEAPAMPLAGCDQEKCQCAYGHHGDRRDQGGDRRNGWGTFGGFTPSIPGGNRRGKSPDRRSEPK